MNPSATTRPLAHIAADGREHLLVDHLQAVAEIAAAFGRKLQASEHARIAGLWHDIGKYSGDFQRMIREENGIAAHIEAEGGPRDHSTAGAVLARDRGGFAATPLVFAIAGHHGGLNNAADLRRRVETKRSLLEAVHRRNPDPSLLGVAPPPLPFNPDEGSRLRFEAWTRMLFSALCDADFLDTERFFDLKRAGLRDGRPSLSALADRLRDTMDRLEADAPPTTVNAVRREVRHACAAAASAPTGIFSLTVPTGGGKTLASLQFALTHALANDLERVVVVIPYTSIIEQSAAVYRRFLGDEAVLEHHSALDPRLETPANRIACENWDAPVVVTTTVEFFESLLSNRPSRCRKLHRLARSVIVLDEAQALPGRLLPTILDVLGDLVAHYSASLVISTATQPAFKKSKILPEGFAEVTEICPSSMGLFPRLERVRVRWPERQEPRSYEDLAGEVAEHPSCLVIVHRRDDARELCGLLDSATGESSTYHLSALMTPQHRSEVLDLIKSRTVLGKPTRVVATQLVEAGVDLDFPVVYRAMAGLDSLAQAAGRCNREGRQAWGELNVFHAPTEPPMGVPRTARDVTVAMLRAAPSTDLFSPSEQLRFFGDLYLRTDLSGGAAMQAARRELRFRDVAEQFRLIEDDWSAPLVIAHGEGADRVAALRSAGVSRAALRALQRYTINVPRRSLATWVSSGVVTEVQESVAVLEGPYLSAYHPRFGLLAERVGILDSAALVQ